MKEEMKIGDAVLIGKFPVWDEGARKAIGQTGIVCNIPNTQIHSCWVRLWHGGETLVPYSSLTNLSADLTTLRSRVKELEESTLPIEFVMWYSGMDKVKVMRAFNRWETEMPKPCEHTNTKNHSENSFYCADCNQIIEF